jgi:hypothetical protein
MPYIVRNAQGTIIGASIDPSEESIEYLPWGHPEVAAFVDRKKEGGGLDIAETDFSMARVTEDLIELLISKNIITLSELPEPAQKKLLARKTMRVSQPFDFDLFGDK